MNNSGPLTVNKIDGKVESLQELRQFLLKSQKKSAGIKETPTLEGGSITPQNASNSGENKNNLTNHRNDRNTNLHIQSRNLGSSMEMIDPKRHPKPKKPMGNDIGMARVLSFPIEEIPGGFIPEIINNSTNADRIEATLSTEVMTAGAMNKELEDAIVARELHSVMDSIPIINLYSNPFGTFQRDSEEERIDYNITQLAQKLAANATRKEFEEGKIAYQIPPATNVPTENKDKSFKLEEVTNANEGTQQHSLKKLHHKEGKSLPNSTEDEDKVAPQKIGKSFVPSNALAQDTPQHNSECSQDPKFLIKEGFEPVTPNPALTGPELGGRLRKEDRKDEEPTLGRSMSFANQDQQVQPFPFFFPDMKFDPNDVSVSIPAGRKLPFSWLSKLGFITEKDES